MKLFDFWTELPTTIVSLFPDLPNELVQFSNVISQSSKLIIDHQHIVISQLNEIHISDLSSEEQDHLSDRLECIENEKASLCLEAIKVSTKILSEVVKYFDLISFPTKENLTQIKITFQITRTLLDKIRQEQSDNINICSTSQAQTNKQHGQKSSFSSNVESGRTDSINTNEENDQEEQRFDFLNMLVCFTEKIQSKLFEKSNEMICIINQSPAKDIVCDNSTNANISEDKLEEGSIFGNSNRSNSNNTSSTKTTFSNHYSNKKSEVNHIKRISKISKKFKYSITIQDKEINTNKKEVNYLETGAFTNKSIEEMESVDMRTISSTKLKRKIRNSVKIKILKPSHKNSSMTNCSLSTTNSIQNN